MAQIHIIRHQVEKISINDNSISIACRLSSQTFSGWRNYTEI